MLNWKVVETDTMYGVETREGDKYISTMWYEKEGLKPTFKRHRMETHLTHETIVEFGKDKIREYLKNK